MLAISHAEEVFIDKKFSQLETHFKLRTLYTIAMVSGMSFSTIANPIKLTLPIIQ